MTTTDPIAELDTLASAWDVAAEQLETAKAREASGEQLAELALARGQAEAAYYHAAAQHARRSRELNANRIMAAQASGRVRVHSSDDLAGLGELADVAEPCAVVIRPDGSVDVYGYIGVVDQRPDVAAEAPGWRCHNCGAGPYDNDLDECGNCGKWRKSCSCGEAWADEPGHDNGPPLREDDQR